MCGLAGFLEPGGFDTDRAADTLTRMVSALRHRGPDDHGIWLDGPTGIALGHRRLSIVDLSAQGHQPMISADGRFVIAYNGEIYNAPELCRHFGLDTARLRGHSDTEVLLEACAVGGVKRAVQQCIGMFAFALWDRHERTLYLARDRLGIKPLYWARHGSGWLFGSELKALRARQDWQARLDVSAVAAYLQLACVPTPLCIYEDAHKLEPGCILRIGPDAAPVQEQYWSLAEIALQGQRQPIDDLDDGLARLDALLRDAVERRMVADVPVGAFLSGGVDSSTVVAYMQRSGRSRVRTFSIRFDDPRYDESANARAVADHLGTEHHELAVSSAQALELIPDLPRIYDEPFSDSSQVPTWFVSRAARESVTVALSGDGGDEGFAGYNRHLWLGRIWAAMRVVPPPLRRALRTLVHALPARHWDTVARLLLPPRYRPRQAGDKLLKLTDLFALERGEQMYRQVTAQWPEPRSLLHGVSTPRGIMDEQCLLDEFEDLRARLQFLDMSLYLPDDILTKVDRASMAVGLEVRVPLLDHRVIELAWQFPTEMKVRNGRGKYPLRQLLQRHVPASLFERPKSGFGIPLDDWLRGPLRDWAESLIGEQALRHDPLIDARAVTPLWQRHLAGHGSHQYALWSLIMLQAWRQRWS
ncbi:MAG: asparagine synthase (glutamine-hydrolyzing) [Gammaproteobacteria bacterium]|nr:asparagine synthase (glutamine-hydrolyzing) [Gammaproteobacteria bacterium]